ncbi:exported hypothetical protein [Candidatus Sulfopaludibacter sp. SbA4]|nr:exported hypothetical protein [Candidatus Sulfopaludibacter sp. SbA4]
MFFSQLIGKHLAGWACQAVLLWTAVATTAAQQTVVSGRVQWYGSHQILPTGEIRIEGHGSKVLRNGEFSFEFSVYHLTGGQKIHIAIKDGSYQSLRVIDPFDGDLYAPAPPVSDLIWFVARPDERIVADAKLVDQHVASMILRESPDTIATSCGPSQVFVDTAVSAFKVTPETVEQILENWSDQVAAEDTQQGHALHWSATADTQTRCNTWLALEKGALSRKLKADTILLDQAKRATPADQLEPLYLEVGESLTRLGAFSLRGKDYRGAQQEFLAALNTLTLAGPESNGSKKQVQAMYNGALRLSK